jgi:hypothetical protein
MVLRLLLDRYRRHHRQLQQGSEVMKVIIGVYGSDAGWLVLDTDTGTLTHEGGYKPAPEEFKHAAQILKHATEVKDDHYRQALIKATSDYFGTTTELLGPSGNVVAIF